MQLLRLLPRFLHRHKCVEILCKLGLQKKILPIKFNKGAKAIVDLCDPEPRNVFFKREFEPYFFHVAKSFLPKDGIFFDLGTNVGFCTFGLCVDRPNAIYHLFEANPKLINLLNQSIELHPKQNFSLNHSCVSNIKGKTHFKIESKQSGQSHVSTHKGLGIQVSNLKLDDYCAELSICNIEFAKIDLEGHELPALEGWRNCLSAHRVKAIYIEIIPENQARYGRPTHAPLSYLESLGYKLYLCKKEDFGFFGETPYEFRSRNGVLLLSHFRAEEYLKEFATDVLALPLC